MLLKHLGAIAAAAAVAVIAAPAQAARTVSHAAYAALLKQANAKVTKAETPLERAFGSKTSTVAGLKRLMLVSAAVSTQVGREFAAARPPEPAAQKAGRDLSRGELAYLQRQHPKGGTEVDRALAELRAAGYRTGS